MTSNPASFTLIEAARRIREGALSSVDYTRLLLERIEESRALNAFISVEPQRVLAAARRADKTLACGGELGPLHGIPLAIKDNIDTVDLPTTAGTPGLRSHRPRADADCVRLVRQAGALVIGKTNMHELAYGLTSDNIDYGAVANPYDPTRMAGGSSGGTACAIAAGLVPAGLGTDTGGSVRVPAALCGIAGLRPSSGRYPQRGLVLVSRTRDTVGPMARTVADLILLDAVLAGQADTGPGIHRLDGLRVAVVRRPFYEGLAPDLDRVVRHRLSELAAAGAELVEVAFPAEVDELIERAGVTIAFYETPVELDRYLRESDLELSVSELLGGCSSPDVKKLFTDLTGPGAVSLAQYRFAISRHRPRLDQLMRQTLDEHRLAVFVWPTTPVTAAMLGTTELSLGGQVVSAFFGYTRTTNPGSIVGWPGVSLPAGLDDAGLPVGLGFDGPPGTDRRLLGIAAACESLFGPLRDPPQR